VDIAVTAVGVCIPVRDEQQRLDGALAALRRAAQHPGLLGAPVCVAVVLDGCTDGSGAIAAGFARAFTGPGREAVVLVRPSGHGNVGAARRAGMAAILAHLGTDDVWLASTDADSIVPPGWLVHQLASDVDAWAGTVALSARDLGSAGQLEQFEVRYGDARRRPVHGANLGVSSVAYLAAGGFPAWRHSEDRGLWRRLRASGALTLHDPGCPVTTSGRRDARAPQGFAAWLGSLEAPAS
jgi:glycosyltransferase involved in cell wall biosynthesis